MGSNPAGSTRILCAGLARVGGGYSCVSPAETDRLVPGFPKWDAEVQILRCAPECQSVRIGIALNGRALDSACGHSAGFLRGCDHTLPKIAV